MNTPEDRVVLRALIAQQHTVWLQSAITQGAAKVFDEEAAKITKYLSDKAFDFSTTPEAFRCYAVQLKVIRLLKEKLFETVNFVDRTVKTETD